MGLDRTKEALAWPARFWRGRGPVVAKRGRRLRTRYADDEVEMMALEDGGLGFLGPGGGPGNRVLHGEQAVRESSVTHALAVRNYLDSGRIGTIRKAHARALQAFRARRAEACRALTGVITQNARREALRDQLADHGLGTPTPRWAGMAFLAI